MNRILHTLRRLRHPAWRYAHRGDLPTLTEWIILAIVMLIMCSGGYAYDTVRMRAEAQGAIDTSGRLLGCLNGRNTLGEYTEEDGSVWQIECSTIDRRLSAGQS